MQRSWEQREGACGWGSGNEGGMVRGRFREAGGLRATVTVGDLSLG